MAPEPAVAPANDSSSSENEEGGMFASGTLLYWKFETGNFWGSIKGFNKDGTYTTTWDDGDVHQLEEIVISRMINKAQVALKTIPERFENGTRVQKYFEDEGGWWAGRIVDHDKDHNYTVQWRDRRLEEWNALYTVAMVQNAIDFKKELLRGESKESNNAGHVQVQKDENDESESSEYIDPDAIRPESFPPTDQGLQNYLSQIDGLPLPQENGGNHVEEPEDAIYRANLAIVASQMKEVPIPILVPNSLVEWEVFIDENDINFSIRCGDNVLVERHKLFGTNESPSEKGEFTIKDVSAPIVLEFDNTFSWWTEKAISYHVKVIPAGGQPTPSRELSPKERAEISLPLILKAMKKAKYELSFSQDSIKAATKNIHYTENRYRQIDKQIEAKQKHFAIAKNAGKTFESRKSSQLKALYEERQRLNQKVADIEKIEKFMRELERERMKCWKEKQQIENSIFDKEQAFFQFADEYKRLYQDTEELSTDLGDLQIEALGKEEDIAHVEKALEDAKAEEEDSLARLTFYEKLEKEVQKRLSNVK